MQNESLITSGLKVMAKVKVFVHGTDAVVDAGPDTNTNADADANGRAMTLAPHICPGSLKIIYKESFQELYIK